MGCGCYEPSDGEAMDPDGLAWRTYYAEEIARARVEADEAMREAYAIGKQNDRSERRQYAMVVAIIAGIIAFGIELAIWGEETPLWDWARVGVAGCGMVVGAWIALTWGGMGVGEDVDSDEMEELP